MEPAKRIATAHVAALERATGSRGNASRAQFILVNGFCTKCGAAVSPTARFCTICGALREAIAPAAAALPPQTQPAAATVGEPRNRRRTWPWWLLAVIAFFLLGLWLGRGPAAKKPLCGSPGSVESGPGKLIQSPGQPIKLGPGGSGDTPSLSGGGPNSKTPVESGVEGEGKEVNGDLPGGRPSGTGGGGDDGASSSSASTGDRLKHDLTKYTLGAGDDLVSGKNEDVKQPPQGKSYSANDFTYDKTNLPRYPDAVSAVVSSISYGPDGRTDTYRTGAGIVTASSFDTVVTWYRHNLPSGWHEMTIGDMQKLSTQLASLSALQNLGAQPAVDPATASSPAASTSSSDAIRISLFSPPAGGTAKVGVMIVQRGDSPVEALLHAKVAPSP